VLNVGQRTAVAGSFRLAGYDGPLMVGSVTSEDERVFLLDADALSRLRDVRTLEQCSSSCSGARCGS
jgi:hypothetical protein